MKPSGAGNEPKNTVRDGQVETAMRSAITFDAIVTELFRFVNSGYGWLFIIVFGAIGIWIVRGPNRIKG